MGPCPRACRCAVRPADASTSTRRRRTRACAGRPSPRRSTGTARRRPSPTACGTRTWVTVRCAACGRARPVAASGAGLPVRDGAADLRSTAAPDPAAEPAAATARPPPARGAAPSSRSRSAPPATRSPPPPLYLRWLGYRDIRRADQRPPSGIGLAARGLLAQVDPTVRPASLRDVECLWLTAMTESADCVAMTESAHCVYFSLAGYAADARARADALGVPLFVLDLTGTPAGEQPGGRTGRVGRGRFGPTRRLPRLTNSRRSPPGTPPDRERLAGSGHLMIASPAQPAREPPPGTRCARPAVPPAGRSYPGR